jgi:post-segregation antitoxin (ccd killing protein)
MACTTCGYEGPDYHDDPLDCVIVLQARIAELEADLKTAMADYQDLGKLMLEDEQYKRIADLEQAIGRLEVKLFEQESTNRKLESWREEDAETIANFARAEVEKDDRIKDLESENEMFQRIAHNADEVGRGLREELAEARDEVAASKQRIQQLYASHERKDAEIAALMEDDQ